MKRYLLFLASFGLAASAIAGPEERVAEIRKWYDSVQKAKPTAERKIAFEAASAGLSGDVTFRDFDNGWKVVATSYGSGSHAGIDEEFYFKDGKLFFAYVVSNLWMFHSDPADQEHKTIDTRTEDRYYYDDKTCIRCLTRSATSVEGDKLAGIVAKLEQKQFDPHERPDGDHYVTPQRAEKLLAAKTSAEVLAAFGVK